PPPRRPRPGARVEPGRLRTRQREHTMTQPVTVPQDAIETAVKAVMAQHGLTLTENQVWPIVWIALTDAAPEIAAAERQRIETENHALREKLHETRRALAVAWLRPRKRAHAVTYPNPHDDPDVIRRFGPCRCPGCRYEPTPAPLTN